MKFRKASLDDIDVLVKCRICQLIDEGQEPNIDITEANREFFRRMMSSGQMEEWVCEEDDRIIATGGLIYYEFPPSFTNGKGLKAYITNIYTAPEFRGRGSAPQMLAILEREARDRGVCRIWLEASRMGKPVYEKYGFSGNDTMLAIEVMD